MEVLIKKLQATQDSLEDALRLESTYEEVKSTKEGNKLLHYLRKRRRAINGITKVIHKFEK